MFKRIITEMRRTVSEMTRITQPPMPQVGAGRKPQGKPPAIKPAFIPPHGMGGTSYMKNQRKVMGAGKPATASNNAAGGAKPMSTGVVSKTMGGTKSAFAKHHTVQGTIGGKPTGGSAGGAGTPKTAKSGSGLKQNGMGQGRENS